VPRVKYASTCRAPTIVAIDRHRAAKAYGHGSRPSRSPRRAPRKRR
jgi:hypothetical protein